MSSVRMYRRSALEAVDCPKRYHTLYEAEDPPVDTNDAAKRGIVFHDIVKVYIRRLASLGLQADHEELRRAVDATIAVHALPPDLVREVVDLVDRWALTFELDLEAFVCAEETQRLEPEEVGARGGVEWTPDLVYARDGELHQLDWKTYWLGFTDREVKSQFQAIAYVWQAAKKWPNFDRYRFSFVFPRLGTVATDVWTREEVEELEIAVQSRIAIIERCRERGEWPEIPGTQCQFCRLDCSIKDHPKLDITRVTSIGNARTIADELSVLERAVTVRREALRAWCGEHGPVVTGGVGWGYGARVQREYPAEEVMALLREHGVERSGITLSATALRGWVKPGKKYQKRYKGLEEQIGVLCKEQKKQVFKRWKVGR